MATQAPLKMYMMIHSIVGWEGKKEASELNVAITTKNVRLNTAKQLPCSNCLIHSQIQVFGKLEADETVDWQTPGGSQEHAGLKCGKKLGENKERVTTA
ncbi:hypothetical protein PtB15_7B809 [Puccinia triticina]|nr:hypothetical protein PtB15_7B809 [Puccinia triticina]